MRWQNILYNHILWKVTYLQCQNNLQFCGTVFIYRQIFIIAFVFIFTQYASCMLTLSPVLWPPDKDRWPDRTNTLHLLESPYWTCSYFSNFYWSHIKDGVLISHIMLCKYTFRRKSFNQSFITQDYACTVYIVHTFMLK